MKVNFTLLTTRIHGGVRAVFEISNGLSKRGHEVTITALEGDHSWFPLDAEVIYVDEPNIIKILNPLNKIKNQTNILYSELDLILKKYKMGIEPDIIKPLTHIIPDCDINVATWFLTSFAVYRSGKGVPFYFFQDFYEIIEPLGQYYTKMFEESLYLPFNIITGSKWLKEWVNENYNKNAVVSGYGIDHTVFYPRSNILNDLSGLKIMGIFRGAEYKGDYDLINALNTLYDDLPDLKLILVSKKDTYEKLVRENDFKFEHKFFESPSDDVLAELYSSADIFVFPSHIEGYGLPPLEAMACKTPVVTADCLGVRDFVVDGENAIMVPPKDPEAIAQAILKLSNDEKLITKFEVNGLKTAEQANWENVVDKFERIFMDSLQK